MSAIRCQRCNEPLGRYQGGRLKLRLALVSFKKSVGGHVCESVCPRCGADVPLPFRLADDLEKSLGVPLPTPSPPVGIRLTLPT